jgi:hypothetical protein
MNRKNDMSLVKLLKEIMISEGDTSGSTDAENVLAILMSNQGMTKEEFAKFYKTKNVDAVFLKDYFARFLNGKPIDVYYGAIKNIKAEKLPVNAKQVGDANFGTTQMWQSYGGIKSVRSKADVIGQGVTYSVKNASTQVRVLDASAPQIIALIHCAMDKTKNTQKVREIIRKRLTTLKELSNEEGAKLSRMFGGKKYGLGELRKLLDTNMKALIKQYDDNTAEMNVEIEAIFDQIQSEKDFKDAFIYESLSGKTMLGENSDGRADAILTWTADFSQVKGHDIKDVTTKITSNFKIPKFASKSSGVRITKTIQMFFQDTSKEVDKLATQENILIKKRNSRLITEGAFSDLWNTLQQKGMDVIKKLIKAIMDFIKKVTDKISGAITDLLSVLGFEVQIQGDYSLDASINYESL